VIAVLADAKFASRLFAVDRFARRMTCPGSLAWPYVGRRCAAAETIAETIAAEEYRPPPQRSRPRFPATEWPNQNRPPVLRFPAGRFADLLSRLHQMFESRIFRRIGKLQFGSEGMHGLRCERNQRVSWVSWVSRVRLGRHLL